jgi:DNA polymerase-3 subunit beta
LITRIIEGGFPDYENVIPTHNNNVATIGKESFLRGLRRVSSIIGRAEPVKITLSENNMEIEANSEIGRAKEVIDVEYGGEDINMSFNVRFVMDVVSHAVGTNIVMSAPSAYGAILFESKGDDQYKNIVMPIRV